MMALFVGLFLSLSISVIAYQRQRLDQWGAVTAVVMGTTIHVTGGWLFTAMMVFFFVSANVVSRWSEVVKPKRTFKQVLANGLMATLLSVLYYFNQEPVMVVLYASSIAVATADTWASEIGLLSKSLPRHILTFQSVAPGTDGAVSLLGIAASVAGATSIGLFVGGSWIVIVAGIAGSVMDSVLGVIQGKGPQWIHGEWSQRGLRWLTNDSVNFFSQVVVVAVLVFLLGPLW
jgi:uncharacterized protein (TIGR00297 family)